MRLLLVLLLVVMMVMVSRRRTSVDEMCRQHGVVHVLGELR